MGKVISITGPSFAGKTYLVSRLIHDIPELKVVYFEKHYIKKDLKLSYQRFYDDIKILSSLNNVLCESVYSPSNNSLLKIEFENLINIVCLPSLDQHNENYRKALRLHGWEIIKKRSGGMSVEMMRSNYKNNMPLSGTYILNDCQNYKIILEYIRGEICG